MEHNINITTTEKELIIRTGTALPAQAPKAITLDGTLGAPFQFKSGKTLSEQNCHIQIQKDKGVIMLIVQDTDPYTTHTIKGSLKNDSVLKLFLLNTDNRWQVSEFLKFIKTMRYYFADKSIHKSLVESLQKWSVKVERVINEHNDNKGNSNFQLQTKVQDTIKGDNGFVPRFDINIPIFQGYDKVKITCEIGLDPKNTEVQLYLISDDLIELEIGQREKLIADELSKFDDFKCSKIVIS